MLGRGERGGAGMPCPPPLSRGPTPLKYQVTNFHTTKSRRICNLIFGNYENSYFFSHAAPAIITVYNPANKKDQTI